MTGADERMKRNSLGNPCWVGKLRAHFRESLKGTGHGALRKLRRRINVFSDL